MHGYDLSLYKMVYSMIGVACCIELINLLYENQGKMMKTLLSETDVELISFWSSKFSDCCVVLLFSVI